MEYEPKPTKPLYWKAFLNQRLCLCLEIKKSFIKDFVCMNSKPVLYRYIGKSSFIYLNLNPNPIVQRNQGARFVHHTFH